MNTYFSPHQFSLLNYLTQLLAFVSNLTSSHFSFCSLCSVAWTSSYFWNIPNLNSSYILSLCLEYSLPCLANAHLNLFLISLFSFQLTSSEMLSLFINPDWNFNPFNLLRKCHCEVSGSNAKLCKSLLWKQRRASPLSGPQLFHVVKAGVATKASYLFTSLLLPLDWNP